MLPKIISPMLILSPRKLVAILCVLGGLVASCNTPSPATPAGAGGEPLQTAASGAFTPAPQGLESTPVQTSANGVAVQFSSEMLGICFSYPQGFTQNPESEDLQIVAPDLPGSDVEGLFWLEISDAYNRTADVIADQEMTFAEGLNVGRWTVTIGGEPAVVLDGMPGQALQRRVYVVHQGTLYILGFWPARSENAAESGQMEALYNAITSTWAWSPCPASE